MSTGIVGLDAFIGGGLPKHRLYLVEGDPGVGKTTLALQFLLSGIEQGERVLLISLAESPDELEAVMSSHGWTPDGLDILTLGPTDFGDEEQYSIMQPSDIELNDTVARLGAEIAKRRPARVVVDSLSELRLLAQTPLRYRRQILALKKLFAANACTALLLDDRSARDTDTTLQSMVHGVLELQKYSPIYGASRRKIQVVKLRGVAFQAGFHDFNIVKGGLEIYPRLVAADFHTQHLTG